jgi:hypothetical protein
MFPVRYELGSYIPEDGILHSDRREDQKSYSKPQIHERITGNLIGGKYYSMS